MTEAIDRPQRPKLKSVSEAAHKAMSAVPEAPRSACGFHLPETKKAGATTTAS